MSLIVLEISEAIRLINDLIERRDLLKGNIYTSKLLISRCSKFKVILERLEKHKVFTKSQETTVMRLREALVEALELVDTFCQPGWVRLVLNITRANHFSNKFKTINSTLTDLSSDLQLDIGISSRIQQEEEYAMNLDDHKLLLKIYEMLKVNNVPISTNLKTTLSRANTIPEPGVIRKNDSVDSIIGALRNEVPNFNELTEDTEMFLDTIYSPEVMAGTTMNDELDVKSSVDANISLSENPLSRPISKTISRFDSLKTAFGTPAAIRKMVESVCITRSKLYDFTNNTIHWKPHASDILGRGSFGIVYRGVYDVSPVAIKVIHGFSSEIPDNEQRMIEREIFILAKCNHENIINFVGCQLDEGMLLTELANTNLYNIIYGLYDALPYYAGGINRTVMKLQWLHDIALGLQYIHFFDIIHRDMKPRNILLVSNGTRLVAKITDFGVSTILGLANAVTITTGTVVGTTAYKAPELFNTKTPIRERYSKGVDIYAFGVMANELMSEELPWAGYPPDDVIIEVRDGNTPKVFKPSTEDPKEFRQQKLLLDIIGSKSKGCFAKDRLLRPDASSIVDNLDLILNKPNAASITLLAKTRPITPSKFNFSSSIKWLNSTLMSFTGNSHPALMSSKSETVFNSGDEDDLLAKVETDSATTVSSTATSSNHKAKHPNAHLRHVRDGEKSELIKAAKAGDVNLVSRLLDSHEYDINAKDMDGWTPLIEAATEGRGRMVQLLLDRGADIKAKTNYGHTALHQAAREGHSTIVRFLIDRGADVDCKGHRQATALHVACANGKLGVVQLLLDKGANIDARDKDSYTPFILAARFGHMVIVHYLLKMGCQADATDKANKTALDWAARNKHYDICSFINDRSDAGKHAPLNTAEFNSESTAALEAVKQKCFSMKAEYSIEPGKSFGNLPKHLHSEYLDYKCYRFFCKPHPLAGRGVFNCEPLEDLAKMSMNLLDVLRNGKSGMRSSRHTRAAQALQWRQKYMASEIYPLALSAPPLRQNPQLINDDKESEIVIDIKQIGNGELKGLGTGTFVWPAAHVMAKYLEKSYKTMRGLRVCDLGSGTGCTGFAAAVLGADVDLTDQECVMFLLEENKKTLCKKYPMLYLEDKISIYTYNWEDKPNEQMNIPYDIVIVSDCVLPKLYPIDILIEGLMKVMSPSTIALFSYEHREYTDYDPRLEFRRLAELRGLSVAQVPIEDHDSLYSCDDIEIWRVFYPTSSNYSRLVKEFSELVIPVRWGQHTSIPVELYMINDNNTSEDENNSSLVPIVINIQQNEVLTSEGVDKKSEVVGSYLWLSAVIASRLILSTSFELLASRVGLDNRPRPSAARVLELGAGCGLTSIAMWLSGYNVLASDTQSVLDLLNFNIQNAINIVNAMLSSKSRKALIPQHLRAIKLNWFEESTAIDSLSSEIFDLVVCADCCYASVAVDPLFQILEKVCGDNTVILLVNELRSSWDEFLLFARKQSPRRLECQEIALTDRDLQLVYGNRLLCPTRPVQVTVGKFVKSF